MQSLHSSTIFHCFLLLLPVGGKEELRPYWQRYLTKALTLVFVVDSSSQPLFPVARKHLHELLASSPLLPLMVLANKQVSVTANTRVHFRQKISSLSPPPPLPPSSQRSLKSASVCVAMKTSRY